MKRSLVIATMVATLISAHDILASGSNPQKEHAHAVVKVGNTICPVSGQNVTSMGDGFEYQYNGKMYTFCCGGCVSTFEKDPKKYSQIAEKSVK